MRRLSHEEGTDDGQIGAANPTAQFEGGTPSLRGLAMSRLAGAVLWGLIAVVGAWPAIAAEGETQVEEAAEENAETDDDPPESHDVFLPTEEISEDFAVPFPVDI